MSGPSQATMLVDMACEQIDLWHTSDDEAFGTIDTGDHIEHWPLNSSSFKKWLAKLFYDNTRRAANSRAIQDAMNVIAARAIYDGPTAPAHLRVGSHQGSVYVDLCDGSWRVVELCADGWMIRSAREVPIRFRRARYMKPLSVPVSGGSIEQLRPFINVDCDEDFALFVGHLIGCFHPVGPYAVLSLCGEQGTAKSTACRIHRRLTDPNKAPLRDRNKEPRDLMVAANSGRVICMDNLSSMPNWLSDALCRLSTGGGFSTRQLYTDSEEIVLEATRPVIINAINPAIRRPDLLDRSIQIHLPTLGDKRRGEAEFWRQFRRVEPAILGALFDAVSAAIRREHHVHIEQLPRMADWAQWVTGAEEALPWEEGTIVAAYRRMREDANDLLLEVSPVATQLRQMMRETDYWNGTASDLLSRLTLRLEHDKPNAWPKSPRGLRDTLERYAPALREVGLSLRFYRDTDRTRTRRISITSGTSGSNGPDGPDRPRIQASADGRTVADGVIPSSEQRPPDGDLRTGGSEGG